MSTNKNASRMAIDNMITEMESRKPTVNVVGIDKMDNSGSYVRVTASVTKTSAMKAGDIPALIASTLNSKLRPVAQSFQVVASNAVGDVITGIFSLNPESIAYDEDMEGFKAVSGNMFMDDEEGLWVLRKTEGGKILVKSTGMEDADIIDGLMPAIASSGIGTMAFEATASIAKDSSVRSCIEGGDFVTFVNPDTETVEFGAVVASVEYDNGDQTARLVVQSSVEGADEVMVDRGMVISQIENVDIGDMEISESGAAKSLAEIAAYYKQMFVRDPAYYEKFMQRFQSVVFA